MSTRVLVVGFDGASPRLISKWASEGKLPAFRKVLEEGAFGQLKSTFPAYTPPAWTSITTGTQPGKHGILYFTDFLGDKRKVFTSIDVLNKRIWDYLSGDNLYSVVVNLPLTYPAKELRGIMISGMDTPKLDSRSCYPAELRDKLDRHGYEIDLSSDELFALFFSDKPALLRRYLEMEERRAELSLQLLKEHRWDFGLIVFNIPDRCQHLFWEFMQSRSRFQDFVYRTYVKMDVILRKFLSDLDLEHCQMFVVSDHGFGALFRNFYINEWLSRNGYLAVRQRRRRSALARLQRHVLPVLSRSAGLAPRRVVRELVKWSLNSLAFNPHTQFNQEDIDNQKSIAYSSASYGAIRLLDKSRDSAAELITKLMCVRDPENGRQVVRKVHTCSELYGPDMPDYFPDLLVETSDGYLCRDSLFAGGILGDPRGTPWNGNHETDGLFMAYGPGVRRNHELSARVWDITPTMLFLLGRPIPKMMDGKAVLEAFEPELLASLHQIFSNEDIHSSTREERSFTDAEERVITDRLRALGYI